MILRLMLAIDGQIRSREHILGNTQMSWPVASSIQRRQLAHERRGPLRLPNLFCC
jgi:hypothetical protein